MSKGSWDRSTLSKRRGSKVWSTLNQNPITMLADKLAKEKQQRATDKKK